MGNFSVALSGLNAQAEALNIVSNNLANLNTTGFKNSSASFHEIVTQTISSSSPNGAGVSAPSSVRNFSQGSVQITSGAFDTAIEGNGFFMLQNASGQSLFTRDGKFRLDASGNLVTQSGAYVLGWNMTNGAAPTGAVGKITIPQTPVIAPVATTKFSLDLNLNASANVGDTFSTPVQVVDSRGATHTVTITFTKTDSNSWHYAATIPSSDLTSSSSSTGTTSATTSLGEGGTLTFDSNGKLTSPAAPSSGGAGAAAGAGTGGTTGGFDIKITGLANGASDLDINWSLYEADNKTATVTQYAQTSAVSGITQDGVPAAQLVNVSIADGGQIVAQFSNGKQQVLAQLALAGILNPSSLVSAGDNNYVLGPDTAAPTVGSPNSGGRGKIQAGALEASTVDIATEFTNLMVYQRSYQANSRVITTMDQLAQELMAMQR